MTQHTQEPWAESNCPDVFPHTIIPVDAYGSTRSDGPIGTVKSAANRARIVACVNACAGMADPVKEIRELRHDLTDLRDHYTEGSLRGMLAAMTAERDKALADLQAEREAVRSADLSGKVNMGYYHCENAKAHLLRGEVSTVLREIESALAELDTRPESVRKAAEGGGQ